MHICIYVYKLMYISGFRVDLVLQVRGLECVHPPAVRRFDVCLFWGVGFVV